VHNIRPQVVDVSIEINEYKKTAKGTECWSSEIIAIMIIT
jgi:hypothetical protein